MFPSRYSGRQPMHDRVSSQTSVSLLARSSGSPQTLSGERHSSRATDPHDTVGYDNRSGHLPAPLSPPLSLDLSLGTAGYDSGFRRPISPPSPPPSLDLSLGPNNRNYQRSTATPSSSTHNQNQSIYDYTEREFFAEPSSSSSQQPNTSAISTRSNSRHQSLYDGFIPALSTAPASSRQQSAANESTSGRSREPYARYPGVRKRNDKWVVEWRDPAQGGRKIWLGSFGTQSQAINALETYKVSRSSQPLPESHSGVYRQGERWVAKYKSKGAQVHVGTFNTLEEAERELQAHRSARRLPPMKPWRGTRGTRCG